MATNDGSYKHPVATLTLQSTPPFPADPPVCYIFPHETLDFGRKQAEGLLGFRDDTISAHHLQFRCLVYEDDEETAVSPMVYAHVQSSKPVQIIRACAEPAHRTFPARRGDQDILLNSGDILKLTATLSLLFQHDGFYGVESDPFSESEVLELSRFSNQYAVSNRVLGWGGQAIVFLATEQYTGRQVACKMVRLPGAIFDEDPCVRRQERERDSLEAKRETRREVERLRRAVNILKFTNHPNIINLEKAVFTPDTIYVFEELITGGDLHSFFQQQKKLAEPNVAAIIRQLLSAVDYLHNNDIVHRDIKPENILMTSWRDGARIVLTDFGQSRTLIESKQPGQNGGQGRMHTAVGTEGYAAPEVIAQKKEDQESIGYSKAIDLWSVGCITALLLTGFSLFPLDIPRVVDFYSDKMQLKRHVNAIDSDAKLGRKAKSFIKGCVTVEEGERLTAQQALTHIWFTDKHYAVEMEAAYRRAIQDWKPRPKRHPLIEHMITSYPAPASTKSPYVNQLAQSVTAKFFNGAPHAATMIPGLPRAPATVTNTYRKPAPLPSVTQDIEMGNATCGTPLASPIIPNSVSDPTQLPIPAFYSFPTQSVNLNRRLSIEDYAPPKGQFTAVPRSPDVLPPCKLRLFMSCNMRWTR